MKAKAAIASPLVLTLGFATTSTASSTWVDPAAGGQWVRPGRVESVQEIVERVEGNPAGGAIAGALIGDFDDGTYACSLTATAATRRFGPARRSC